MRVTGSCANRIDCPKSSIFLVDLFRCQGPIKKCHCFVESKASLKGVKTSTFGEALNTLVSSTFTLLHLDYLRFAETKSKAKHEFGSRSFEEHCCFFMPVVNLKLSSTVQSCKARFLS